MYTVFMEMHDVYDELFQELMTARIGFTVIDSDGNVIESFTEDLPVPTGVDLGLTKALGLNNEIGFPHERKKAILSQINSYSSEGAKLVTWEYNPKLSVLFEFTDIISLKLKLGDTYTLAQIYETLENRKLNNTKPMERVSAIKDIYLNHIIKLEEPSPPLTEDTKISENIWE